MKWLCIVMLCCISRAVGLYFIMGEKESRCFFDEFMEGSVVSFQYNATMRKGPPVGLVLRVTDPARRVIFEREYGSGSRATFKVEETGEHALCVSTNSTKWAMYATGTVKVHFRFAVDYSAAEKQDSDYLDKDDDEPDQESTHGDIKLSTLEYRVKDVMKSLKFVAKSMETHRRAEERFRSIAESTNSRVLFSAILQVGLLLITGFWQMRNLKGFFIAKKIV